MKIGKIEDLGYHVFFENARLKLKLDKIQLARVISERRGVYKVKNTKGEYAAKITGTQRFKAVSREDYPAVGDWVAIAEVNEDQAIIRKILPRKTVMKRKGSSRNEVQIIATNIDVAFIVESVGRDFSLNRFERYFSMAKDGGIRPVIILNKIDLISQEELKLKIDQIKKRFGKVDIILTSAVALEGLDELKKLVVKRKTYCFLGSSGVGKSSLINKLLEESVIRTEDIGQRSGRGKHVTTGREMYFLKNGGIVIDNPGVREMGMTDAKEGVESLFAEISVLSKKCKYVNCSHVHEPGCEVLSAVDSGKLDEDKYNNYINLKKETEHYELNKFKKREKDRQIGKFIKKAKEEFKKIKNKNYD